LRDRPPPWPDSSGRASCLLVAEPRLQQQAGRRRRPRLTKGDEGQQPEQRPQAPAPADRRTTGAPPHGRRGQGKPCHAPCHARRRAPSQGPFGGRRLLLERSRTPMSIVARLQTASTLPLSPVGKRRSPRDEVVAYRVLTGNYDRSHPRSVSPAPAHWAQAGMGQVWLARRRTQRFSTSR